jgi:hypothetical protein
MQYDVRGSHPIGKQLRMYDEGGEDFRAASACRNRNESQR